jgi:hypothetical protein
MLVRRVTDALRQAFFALMNVAVKKLNSLDPPVSVMELVAVRMVRLFYHNQLMFVIVLQRSAIGYYMDVLCFLHVGYVPVLNKLYLFYIRYFTKIPDPFLGPPGVRLLLAFRGFCGYVQQKILGLGIYGF